MRACCRNYGGMKKGLSPTKSRRVSRWEEQHASQVHKYPRPPGRADAYRDLVQQLRSDLLKERSLQKKREGERDSAADVGGRRASDGVELTLFPCNLRHSP